MFDNDRYITRRFYSSVPLELQLTIFQLVDELKTKGKMDYLQVFELVAENRFIQKIEHRSESPEYKKKYRFAFLTLFLPKYL